MVSRKLTLVLALGLGTTALGAPLAHAEEQGSPQGRQAAAAVSTLPSLAAVKKAMHGRGVWNRNRGSIDVVGSKPSACNSQALMLNYRDVRVRLYSGQEKGLPRSIWSNANATVFRYPDVASAKRAVANTASYARRCPEVTEWVCTECDGIWTTWRTRVRAPQIGAQRVIWRFREQGNFKSNGYTVVARRGATVVRVTVSRTRDVSGAHGWRYPPRIEKKVAVRVARLTLRSAT